MSVNVRTGCMMSGKTIESIKNATTLLDVLDEKGLFINNKLDDRDSKHIVSSNSSGYNGISNRFDIYSVNYLDEMEDKMNLYNVCCIDESQFFTDLEVFVKKWLKLGKHFFISGLNSDWKGEDFGQIKDLLCVSTSFIVLNAKCVECLKEFKLLGKTNIMQIADACMTGKISGSNSQIETGGKDKYVPLCYKHHCEFMK